MNGSFSLYPADGARFDVAGLRRFLLGHAAAVASPRHPDEVIVAANRADAESVGRAMAADPDQPQWVVVLRLDPAAIFIWREAGSEELAVFAPMLTHLLEHAGVARVLDEEGREYRFASIVEAVATLLG